MEAVLEEFSLNSSLTVAKAIGSFDPAMRDGPGVGLKLNGGAHWFKHDLVLAVRNKFEIIIFFKIKT